MIKGKIEVETLVLVETEKMEQLWWEQKQRGPQEK